MKENYKAWHIAVNNFPLHGTAEEQLTYLIGFGILAPSSHNSQPWSFRVQRGAIELSVAPSRILPKSDENFRQLFISLGAAIENMLVAADYFGVKLEEVVFSPGLENNIVATLRYLGTSEIKHDANHLMFFIPKRHTNRNKYETRLPEAEFIQQLQALQTSDTQVAVITDKNNLLTMADTVITAGIEAMENKCFREELSHYIISNISASPVGMPGFTIGMPLPVSLVAPQLIRRVNMSKLTKGKDAALLKKHTPALVVISTQCDDKASWLRAGKWLEKILLLAEREGLASAPMAAAIQIGDYYKALQQSLATDFRPQVFFRLGYSLKTALPSPRLSVDEVQ